MNLPNKLSIIRIIAVPFFSVTLFLALDSNIRVWRYIAVAFFLLVSLTDAMDGYIARKTHKVTEIGKWLDPLADKILVVTAILFLTNRGIPAWIGVILIWREILIVGLRTIMPDNQTLPANVLGKAKTFLLTIGIIMVLLNYQFAFWLILSGTFFSVISCLDYLISAKHMVKKILCDM